MVKSGKLIAISARKPNDFFLEGLNQIKTRSLLPYEVFAIHILLVNQSNVILNVLRHSRLPI